MTLSEVQPVIVDTSVVSILYNRIDNDVFQFYEQSLAGYELQVSFQTLEEIRFGAYLRNWGKRRICEMQEHLSQFDVVWPDSDVVDACARLRSQTRRAGRELSQADAWIAATAATLECPLASDDRDFDDIPEISLIQRPR